MNNYYVYIYWRLDINEPFYIGKGHGKRWKVLKRENTNFNRIVNKYPIAVEIIKDNLTEQEAFYWEEKIINTLVFEYGYSINIKNNRSINKYRHLVNMTWGGEGNSGYTHTKIWKENASKTRKGENNPNYKNYWTEEQKENVSKKQKERFKNKENHPNYNKKMSEEQKKKISKTRIEKGIGKGKDNSKARSVICLTTKRIFFTMKEAGKYYKIGDYCRIGMSCRKERKSCGKYKGQKLVWRYLVWNHGKVYRISNK